MQGTRCLVRTLVARGSTRPIEKLEMVQQNNIELGEHIVTCQIYEGTGSWFSLLVLSECLNERCVGHATSIHSR